MIDLKTALTRKIGPLPTWGWGVAVGGALLVWRVMRGERSTSGVPIVIGGPGELPNGGGGGGGGGVETPAPTPSVPVDLPPVRPPTIPDFRIDVPAPTETTRQVEPTIKPPTIKPPTPTFPRIDQVVSMPAPSVKVPSISPTPKIVAPIAAAKKTLAVAEQSVKRTGRVSPALLGEVGTQVGSGQAQLLAPLRRVPTTRAPAPILPKTTTKPPAAPSISPGAKAEVAIRSGVQQTAKATTKVVRQAAKAKTTVQKLTTRRASGGTAPTAKKMV